MEKQDFKIILALGANTGNKFASIQHAIELLEEKIKITKQASVYETKPWGYEDQDFFLNTALVGITKLNPAELLQFIKEVELKVGRQKRFVNGPREIDIDILFYDDLILKTPELTIPHERLHERDFVLVPVIDIEPNLIHPELNKSMTDLLNKISKENLYVIRKYVN